MTTSQFEWSFSNVSSNKLARVAKDGNSGWRARRVFCDPNHHSLVALMAPSRERASHALDLSGQGPKMSSLLSDLQLSAARQALFCTDEDAMTKKSSGKDTKIKQDPKKPGAPELQDDELQQVSGGLAATRTALPTDPVCVSKL